MLTKRHLLTALPALALRPALAQDAAIARGIAPTGVLRAAINIGNPILATRAPGAAAPRGVSVDMATELARRLAVPLELVVVPSAGRAVEVMRAENADIGFFAVDAARGQGIDFTSPYVEIEGAYLVQENSPIRTNEEVDSRGVRIAVGLNSVYDLFLRREIRQASLVRVASSPQVVEEFMRQRLEVAAGVRQQLEADMRRFQGLRMLPDRFMVIRQAMGLGAERDPAALSYLISFVEELKASGFMAEALARHGIHGASVAAGR